MRQRLWPSLQPGDIVDIVLPAGRPRRGTLQGIQKFLDTWQLQGRIPKKPVGQDLICAHSKEKRWQQLKAALQAKDSKMIWCVRGGYGSLHLVDELEKIKAPPIKIFLGYSDITTLHTFFVQKWGWSTLHGPNIDRFALGTGSPVEASRLYKTLFGQDTSVNFSLRPLNGAARKSQSLQSSIIGGNLITLQSSFGTSASVKTKGQILFLEEIGERAYKIDRVLEHMRQLSLLKDVKAVVLGQFTEGDEPNGRKLVPAFLKQWALEQKFPVVMGLPCGHGPNQKPLPLGTKALLQLGEKPHLTVATGVQNS